MEVAELILEALRVLNIDQAGLAKRLKRGQPTVSRWLSGDAKPDYESCLRLAQITGMPAATVLETVGLDPDLLPLTPREARAVVDVLRQSARDELDRWVTVIGSEYEPYYWASVTAQAESTAKLINDLKTAVSAPTDTADSGAVSAPRKRGRRKPNNGSGPLTTCQHASNALLAVLSPLANRRRQVADQRRAA